MLVPAGVHVMVSCGFVLQELGGPPHGPPGSPWVLFAQFRPSCMRLGDTFVGSMFLFCGVRAIVSYVSVLLFAGIGVPLGWTPGSPWGFVCPVQALLHAPWGLSVGSMFLF